MTGRQQKLTVSESMEKEPEVLQEHSVVFRTELVKSVRPCRWYGNMVTLENYIMVIINEQRW